MVEYSSFVQKQIEYMSRCRSSWLNIAEGGKRAGKNVMNILAWALQLEKHQDKLHLASGVTIATAKLNIIDSNGFGLRFWFDGRCKEGKYQQRDALYINTITGEKIVLISGGGNEGDEKLIKGNTYGTVYCTEGNECAISFVREIFDRTISSSNRQLYFDINPKNPNHWFYSDVIDLHMANNQKYPDYGFNYEHFTIFDNLSITDSKLEKILITYDRQSFWFKRDILGRRVAPHGVIYSMFDERIHMKHLDYVLTYWDRVFISIDYGIQNPMTFGKYGVKKDYYHLFDYYYHCGRDTGKQKTDGLYADQLEAFIGNDPVKYISIDPSATSFIAELRSRRFFKDRQISIVNAKNAVLKGIQALSMKLQQGKFTMEPHCVEDKKEFMSYIWDAKATARGVDEPLKENDHCMDRNRYSVYTDMILFKDRVNLSGKGAK